MNVFFFLWRSILSAMCRRGNSFSRIGKMVTIKHANERDPGLANECEMTLNVYLRIIVFRSLWVFSFVGFFSYFFVFFFALWG